MIEQAQRRYPAVTFIEGDASKLPFENGSFDAVVMNFVLLFAANFVISQAMTAASGGAM